MKPLLRVLNVEDSEDDTRLLLRELARSDYEIVHKRVETAEALGAALDQESWDILFCDFTLPGFTGRKALEIVRERDIDLPFIFVSGTLGEDVAVQAMKAGAHDYVMKNNLARLVPAMEREVVEAKVRRRRRQADEGMRISEYKYRRLFESLGDAAFLIDTETARIIDANPQAEVLLGRSRAEILGTREDQLYSPQRAWVQQSTSLPAGALERRFEADVLRKDLRIVPVHVTVSEIELYGRHILLVLFHDLTERKRSEEKSRNKPTFSNSSTMPFLSAALMKRFRTGTKVLKSFTVGPPKRRSAGILGTWPIAIALRSRRPIKSSSKKAAGQERCSSSPKTDEKCLSPAVGGSSGTAKGGLARSWSLTRTLPRKSRWNSNPCAEREHRRRVKRDALLTALICRLSQTSRSTSSL